MRTSLRATHLDRCQGDGRDSNAKTRAAENNPEASCCSLLTLLLSPTGGSYLWQKSRIFFYYPPASCLLSQPLGQLHFIFAFTVLNTLNGLSALSNKTLRSDVDWGTLCVCVCDWDNECLWILMNTLLESPDLLRNCREEVFTQCFEIFTGASV